MGVINHLSIESKFFTVSKRGSFVFILEKSWRVLKEMKLGSNTAHWFARFLFDCVAGSIKDFYSTIREGNRRFVAQLCSNANGRFMELAEYGGGKRSNFLFFPEDVKGKGWSGVAEALWATVVDGKSGGARWRQLAPPAPHLNRSFLEAASSSMVKHAKTVISEAPYRVGGELQRAGGMRNGVNGKAEADLLKTLVEVQRDLAVLQKKVDVLVRTELAKKKVSEELVISGVVVTETVSEAGLVDQGKDGPVAGFKPKTVETGLVGCSASGPVIGPKSTKANTLVSVGPKLSKELGSAVGLMPKMGLSDPGSSSGTVEPEPSMGGELTSVQGLVQTAPANSSVGQTAPASSPVVQTMPMRASASTSGHQTIVSPSVQCETTSLVEPLTQKVTEEASASISHGVVASNGAVPDLGKESDCGEGALVLFEPDNPSPLDSLNSEESSWVTQTAWRIKNIIGISYMGFEAEFLALLTATEAAHAQSNSEQSTQLARKKDRELKRLTWDMNVEGGEKSSSRERGKGRGKTVSQ